MRKSIFDKHPLPWKVEDEGDDKTSVVDARGICVVMATHELNLEWWKEIVARVNEGKGKPC
jgi:hypothetical protein